jgi:hypothetical protein
MQTNYNYLQAEDKVIDQATYVRCGSKAALTAMKCDFRYAPDSGLHSDIAEGPFRAHNGHFLIRRPAIFPRAII